MLERRRAWAVAIVATLTMTVSYMDRQTLAVLAPTVTKALGISETEYGWLASAFSIAYLVATPLSGWWIDRVGARRGLVASVLVWSAVAALHALVPGFAVLFALRIALGITEGPSFPGAAQTMQRVLPPDDRPRGFGVLFTGSSIGGMLVPLLATSLFAWQGWRAAFLGTALAGLAWIPLWLLATRSPAVRAKLDHAGDGQAEPRPSFAEIVRHPNVLRAVCAIFAAAPLFGYILNWGSKYLVGELALTQTEVGPYLLLPPFLFDAGAILFGDLASRHRKRSGGAPARLLFAISLVLAASLAVLPLTTGPWAAMICAGIGLAGGGGLYTIATADLLSRMPQNSVSLCGGLTAGAQSLALIITMPLIGRAVDHYGGYDEVTIAIAVWTIPGSLVWLLWRPRDRPTLPVATVVSASAPAS